METKQDKYEMWAGKISDEVDRPWEEYTGKTGVEKLNTEFDAYRRMTNQQYKRLENSWQESIKELVGK